MRVCRRERGRYKLDEYMAWCIREDRGWAWGMGNSMHLYDCGKGKITCCANELANSTFSFSFGNSHHRSKRLEIRPGSLPNDENGG